MSLTSDLQWHNLNVAIAQSASKKSRFLLPQLGFRSRPGEYAGWRARETPPPLLPAKLSPYHQSRGLRAEVKSPTKNPKIGRQCPFSVRVPLVPLSSFTFTACTFSLCYALPSDIPVPTFYPKFSKFNTICSPQKESQRWLFEVSIEFTRSNPIQFPTDSVRG